MKIFKLSQTQNNQHIHMWLDDNRDPKDPENQRRYGAKGNELWVKTIEEAQPYIERGEVASISFDNDLGLPTEGKHLARWIEDQAYWKKIPPMEWHVHSENSVAKKEIIAAMSNADRFWESAENIEAEPLDQKSYQERYDRWTKN